VVLIAQAIARSERTASQKCVVVAVLLTFVDFYLQVEERTDASLEFIFAYSNINLAAVR
jgi:hypothetical protein